MEVRSFNFTFREIILNKPVNHLLRGPRPVQLINFSLLAAILILNYEIMPEVGVVAKLMQSGMMKIALDSVKLVPKPLFPVMLSASSQEPCTKTWGRCLQHDRSGWCEFKLTLSNYI